jgi:SAM-dependent methyltransferase
MTVIIINPHNSEPLHHIGGSLVDASGNSFPLTSGVARIAKANNYTENFGIQWNKFDKTQMDCEIKGFAHSRNRFFKATEWELGGLKNKDVLEVGSGAGRFSRVVLEHTQANLYSIDYSDAVTANFSNNGNLAPGRFYLFQASVYEMPFPDNSFDKVFCFGVLQHTPSFVSSIRALIAKTKPGGEIVVDFYPIMGWWTKLHAKYMLRPLTRNLSHHYLFKTIDANVDWLIKLSRGLTAIGLGKLTRFVPLVDLKTLPRSELTEDQFREWVVLDTFDMFSPAHDHPQKIEEVAVMFESNGAAVTFAGVVEYSNGQKVAVVRGIKK